ncbi:hypothetical protein HAT86_06875 [Roseovarius gahaiensis]|uniref:Uncharacterized protein n=1 Tax=Roseovarius gahaiensis TaxID=2716691 RepID=A0A967BH56_9RHOB|nr:hypothetical protein [Roseovarius gahaiensis]NHQ74187.1 hypothetical protein [Roseovarius gahaiensis]
MLGLEQALLALITGVVCLYLPGCYLMLSEARHNAEIQRLGKNLNTDSAYVYSENKFAIKNMLKAQIAGAVYGRLISTSLGYVFQCLGGLISVWSIISLLINIF